MEKNNVNNWEKLNLEEQKEICKIFTNWLEEYTDKVILKVMEKKEEILANSTVIAMLKELYKLEKDDKGNIKCSIMRLLRGEKEEVDFVEKYGIHSKYSNSKSYRNVLYDLYIKDR